MDRRRYLSAVSATAMGVLSAGCSQTQTEQTRTEQSRALSLNWVFDTRNKAEIAARGDPLSMWVENCSTATADAILGTAESLSVSFD